MPHPSPDYIALGEKLTACGCALGLTAGELKSAGRETTRRDLQALVVRKLGKRGDFTTREEIRNGDVNDAATRLLARM
jgi:hypothetical protein